MHIFLLELRHWLARVDFVAKSGYLCLALAYLLMIFIGFGPFMTITDPNLAGSPVTLTGFDFLYENPAGNFVALAALGLTGTILIFLIAAVTIFLPAGKGDRLYWLLLVLGGLMLLAYGVAYNYYLFSFALGEFSKGVSFRIGWAGILYDCLMYLSWIPFIILRNHYLGGRSTQPIFGTNLDEDQGRKD